MGNGIDRCGAYVAELAVDGPDVDAAWYLLAGIGGVVAVGIEVTAPLVTLGDVARFVNLVESLRMRG